jgi:hypothetical protein
LDAEFTACQTAGILLCICAGNQGANNDLTPNYPSSYPHANIIAIGNHDRTDVRWSGSFNPSNYGAVSVDLFAPGRDILAPVLGAGYANYTGTSQATPFVTAVAAALKYLHPTWQAPEIKRRILDTVTKRSSYAGLCTTGGRLNAAAAVALSPQTVAFGPLVDKSFGDAPFPLAATASSGLSPTFSVMSGPAAIAGNTVTLAGVGAVVIRAEQPGDENYAPAASVDQSFTVASDFLWWQQTRFSAAELANPSVSGPGAVYGADGLSNLLKYALGLEPKSNVVVGLPSASKTATEWVFTYTRPTAMADLTYAVEFSSDLVHWTTDDVTNELVSSTGAIDTWRGRHPLTAATAGFFRLKIVRP